MQAKIPTTIISGFLGSGKTTIIRGLLEDLSREGKKVIYIKNEVGETDIDGKLLSPQTIATEEILNGCICCTLVGPFLHAIDELLAKYHADRIIIEASGSADPSSIAMSVSSHPGLLRDTVIVVIDVLNFNGYEDLTETTRAQAQFTDLIVFNKVELADITTKRAVVGYVRELNNHSPIIEAHRGRIPLALALGTTTKELNVLLQKEEDEHAHADHHHIEEDDFGAFTLTFPGIFDKDVFEETVAKLPVTIFRMKGFLKTSEGFLLWNRVGNRSTYEPIDAHESISTLVFIGYRADEQKNTVHTLLSNALST